MEERGGRQGCDGDLGGGRGGRPGGTKYYQVLVTPPVPKGKGGNILLNPRVQGFESKMQSADIQ